MVAQTERRGTLRKNGNEKAAVDTWSLTEDRKRNENIRQTVEDAHVITRKQDCDGMGTCSEEKMIAVSKRS